MVGMGLALLALVLVALLSPARVAQGQPAACDPGAPRCFTVTKAAPSSNGQSFSFVHVKGATNTPFNLTDGESASFTLPDLETHTVTETVPAGWDLANINCEGQGVDVAVNLAGNSVSVTFDIGDASFATVTCVFTNEREPTSTPTPTNTPTNTPTATPTSTPTPANTPTPTGTPSNTLTPTSTPTATPTGTVTDTPTAAPTGTLAPGSTPTAAATMPASPSVTPAPPATGTGGAGGHNSLLAMTALAAALLIASGTVLGTAVRRR
jgi:hypothetical protein